MQFLQENLASLVALFGTTVSFIGLIQSRTWLAGIGALCLAAALIAALYARRERMIISSAAITIDGLSIDALNIANLRRRVNRSLVIQGAHHQVQINHEDLSFMWRYTGYCRTDRETAIEFSVDAESAIPFDRLECFGFDLGHDPGKKHPIRPILVGPDGISKKLAVPFLEPLTANQSFEVTLECRIPECMKSPEGYYISTLAFGQDCVRRYTVRLLFVGEHPDWVRVYECTASGNTTLLRDLQPRRQDRERTEYLDAAEDVEGQSARIYVFRRDSRQRQ